ncbi:Hypothetical predicted protein, partial [Lecanosticta acicola]
SSESAISSTHSSRECARASRCSARTSNSATRGSSVCAKHEEHHLVLRPRIQTRNQSSRGEFEHYLPEIDPSSYGSGALFTI